MELLTAAQMQDVERRAIESGAVTGLELMERAGRGVVDSILEEWPELALSPHRAVVLCGRGNNGGDGFVVARLLKQRGWEVIVYLDGDLDRLPKDAAKNCRQWQDLGPVLSAWPSYDDYKQHSENLDQADVVVDALMGMGLNRGYAPPEFANWFYHDRMCDGMWWSGIANKPYLVSIDIVSELDADSGQALSSDASYGGEMGAHLTVTFHRLKLGHALAEGPALSSRVKLVDIGLEAYADSSADQSEDSGVKIVRLADRLPDWDRHHEWEVSKNRIPRFILDHKYKFGHALVLSGGPGFGGAARLAARGALRIGAGLVSVGCPTEAMAEHAAHLTAIMIADVPSIEEIARIADARKITAICLGPGLGIGPQTKALVHSVTKLVNAVVLDADALTSFEDDPDALFACLNIGCVITPHAGEFKRLFPDLQAKLEESADVRPAYSKVDATRDAAKRAGCTVLYKGPDTVIASADGRCAVSLARYERSAPWLATAGSGDVLAGFITGLLARGFAPQTAAETAAFLHVECALKFGPGLIAEDLPEQLPAVFRDLGL